MYLLKYQDEAGLILLAGNRRQPHAYPYMTVLGNFVKGGANFQRIVPYLWHLRIHKPSPDT
ncbi:hypothetical protein EMIT0P265_180005 [Pseudomonas zeae]